MRREPTPRRNPLLPVAVFAAALALSAAAYWPGVRAEHVSDDVNAIVENEWVRDRLDVAGIFTNFSWWGTGRADAPGYRPLVTLSFALNRAAGGLSTFGFHVTNYVWHALACAFVFAAAAALGLGVWAAAGAALASCLLPIHSEAVIWAVGRAELGAAAAFLAVTSLALRYRDRGGTGSLVAAGAVLITGMMCKENTVTVLAAPAVFALLLPGDRTRRRRDAVATAALLAAFGIYVLIRVAADGPALPGAEDSLLDNQLSRVPTYTRLLGSVSLLGRYLWLTLWPHPLSVDYSYDALALGQGFVLDRYSIVAIVAVAACAWAAYRLRERAPAVAVSLVLAAASYSIVSNTVYPIGTIFGERLFYLPSALLCIAAAAAAEAMLAGATPARRTRLSDAWSSPRAMSVLAAVAVVCAVWVVIDQRRAAQWRTPITLFESAVAAAPRSARAHMELGSAYGKTGRIEDARGHFEQALAIWPEYTVAAYNYGNALVRAGRYGEAEAAYRKALDQDPRFVRAWHNLALVYGALQRHEDAADAYTHALELSPRDGQVRTQHAEALLAAGRNQDAEAAYDAMIAMGGDNAVTRFNRGVARHRRLGCPGAVDDYRAAASMPGAPVQAVNAAVGCLRQLGRDEEAAALAQGGKVANRDSRR